MEATRIRLAEGVHLTYLPARKFKTSLLSAQFVTPLRQETAGANALLAAVLRRGTVSCPDMGALSAKMDNLYDASIDYTVRKKGENQCVGFVASFIDDRYAPGGERLLEPVAALLGELVCDPVTYHGRFVPEYFESEKTNLLDAIRSQSTISGIRPTAVCCGRCATESPTRVAVWATRRAVDKLQSAKALCPVPGSDLHRAAGAYIQRQRRSGTGKAGVGGGICHAAPGGDPGHRHGGAPSGSAGRCKRVEEAMDVTQGKLGMGFACGSDDYAALLMGNTLFGGSSNSKLFLNVREKLSLCYYASSVYHRQKRLITVSSGIEFQNYQRAYDEIMAQLAAVQAGRLEDWELEGARSTLLNAYASMGDSQGKLENFYLGQAATGQEDTPELLAEQVRT